MRILVLCAGNIGRSPLAEVLIRSQLAGDLGISEQELERHGVAVASAGTDALEGHPASRRGIAFALSRGLDLGNHSATQVTTEALGAADLIYCMDRHQLDAVFRLEPNAAGRAQLLAGEGIEIPDPHFQNDEFFREVAARIERAVADRKQELLERISRSEGEDGPTAR